MLRHRRPAAKLPGNAAQCRCCRPVAAGLPAGAAHRHGMPLLPQPWPPLHLLLLPSLAVRTADARQCAAPLQTASHAPPARLSGPPSGEALASQGGGGAAAPHAPPPQREPPPWLQGPHCRARPPAPTPVAGRRAVPAAAGPAAALSAGRLPLPPAAAAGRLRCRGCAWPATPRRAAGPEPGRGGRRGAGAPHARSRRRRHHTRSAAARLWDKGR